MLHPTLKAAFTLLLRKLKTRHRLPVALNHRSSWICDYRDTTVLEKLPFHTFRPHENEKLGMAFPNLQFEARFREAPFSVRVSVDSRPNRGNKAAFSNSSGVI